MIKQIILLSLLMCGCIITETEYDVCYGFCRAQKIDVIDISCLEHEGLGGIGTKRVLSECDITKEQLDSLKGECIDICAGEKK